MNQFHNDLCSKDRFDTLLPFLSQSFDEIINADEIRIFTVDQSNEFFTAYRLFEGRLAENKHDFTGIPFYVMQNKFHLFIDFLNASDFPSFSEETDGWAVNKPFGAFPIFQSKGKVSAVLCLTGKNKFGESEFEFLMSVTPLLALIIPRCIEMSKLLSAEECEKTMKQYPSTISKFTFENLQKEKAISSILAEMQKGTKAEIISAYISNKDDEFERLMTLKNGKVLDSDFVDSEFIKLVDKSENPINETDPSKLSLSPKFRSIMAVSNKEDENRKIVIVCLNSLSSTGRFDTGYHLYLTSFSSFINHSIEILNRDKEIEDMKEKASILEAAFKDCEEALKYPNPLLAIIQSILKKIQMDDFMLLRYKPLNQGYECILASEKCKRATISEENQFITKIKNLTKPTKIKKSSINSSNSIFELFPNFSKMVVNPLDSGLFLICTGNSIHSNHDLYFSSFSPL